jgi:DNA-binding IscR family transcriptional regulator
MGHRDSRLLAVHILVLLTDRAEPISSYFLQAATGASASRIRQVMVGLREAGLVESRLGPGGGARLARPAPAITLAEVYGVVTLPAPTTGFNMALAAALEPARAALNAVTIDQLARAAIRCSAKLAISARKARRALSGAP